MLDVRRQLAADGIGADADVHGEAGGPQLGEPCARDMGIGILDAADYTADAGLDDGVGARPGAASMAARLERRVERRPGRVAGLGGGVDGDDLGMAVAGRLSGTAEGRAVRSDEHGADPGIG